MTLQQVVEGVAIENESTQESAERFVRATLKRVGLEVNERTGEVYNPAEGAYRSPAPRVVPRDQHFRIRHRR